MLVHCNMLTCVASRDVLHLGMMKPLSEYPPLMSVRQVAEATGLSVRTVWRKLDSRELTGHKLGQYPTSPVKVPRMSVERWLAGCVRPSRGKL